MKFSLAVWVELGTNLFANLEDVKKWEARAPRPIVSFKYWCSTCEQPFESNVTPIECMNGHKAVDQIDRVELEHKGYVNFTFPFYGLHKGYVP